MTYLPLTISIVVAQLVNKLLPESELEAVSQFLGQQELFKLAQELKLANQLEGYSRGCSFHSPLHWQEARQRWPFRVSSTNKMRYIVHCQQVRKYYYIHCFVIVKVIERMVFRGKLLYAIVLSEKFLDKAETNYLSVKEPQICYPASLD